MSEKEQKIEELEKEIERLKEENDSLWFMLDEIKKSDITNLEYQKHYEKITAKINERKKMMSTKVGEA
jgi:predicted RNase H-like nuclease (RuvC/YqgF family)